MQMGPFSPHSPYTGYPLGQQAPFGPMATEPRAQPVMVSRELLRDLETTMTAQVTAAAFYRNLIGAAQRAGAPALVVELIRHAMEDELEHFRLLGELYRPLTGRTYRPAAASLRFATLREGLQAALVLELEAVEEYRSIYLRERDPRIRDLFFRLMTDEMEHAIRFSFAHQFTEPRQVRMAGPAAAPAAEAGHAGEVGHAGTAAEGEGPAAQAKADHVGHAAEQTQAETGAEGLADAAGAEDASGSGAEAGEAQA